MTILRTFFSRFTFAAVVALGATACAFDTAETAPSSDDEAAATTIPTIKLLVTVDWEGDDLADANLRAMESLRADYPSVHLTQFLNAAYFTKPGADAASVAHEVRRAVRANDELGLEEELVVRDGRTGDLARQEFDDHPAHRVDRLADGRQRRVDRVHERRVIEPDDRDVVGDFLARPPRRPAACRRSG